MQVLAEWTRHHLLRPLLFLVSGMLFFNIPTLLYKIRLIFRAILYFFLCWDYSWLRPMDPGSIFGPHLSQGLPVERKTIYFVRHGESTWNDTFNKGSDRTDSDFFIGFVPRFLFAILHELYLLLSGKLDSWFYDSPLSWVGLKQVKELAVFLQEKPLNDAEAQHVKILRADSDAPSSKILCSNLRRASSTMAGCCADRFARHPDEKILVVPCLQEISRNPDTLSITPPHAIIQASWIERTSTMCDFQKIFDRHFDMSLHTGDKPLDTNGLKRMLDFCEFVFSSSVKEECVIAGGHSLWFRAFFQTFLPYSVHHVSKNEKVVNGGVITFDLMRAETRKGPKYMIDPKTIKVVYGGF